MIVALILACALYGTLLVPSARAQRREREGVLLRIHPHVGDTLHTRLDQQTEVTAMMPGGSGARTKSVTTSIALNSRTIVQASFPASTTVLTMVDSADLHTSDAHGAAQVAEAEHRLLAQRLVLQLAADGAVESAHDLHGTPVSQQMAETMSTMPAIFPHHAVNVGEQWTREMPLPSGGPLGTRGSGHVNAVFRLDSLDRSGSLAFISMHGEILPEGTDQGMEVGGEVTGAMQVNRTRGWMTDSRFSVLVRSLVTPPPSSGLAPMRFITRVTQRLRTMDKR